jgi:hypothetical protein
VKGLVLILLLPMLQPLPDSLALMTQTGEYPLLVILNNCSTSNRIPRHRSGNRAVSGQNNAPTTQHHQPRGGCARLFETSLHPFNVTNVQTGGASPTHAA